MNDETKNQIAVFRFSLIAPIINRTFTQRSVKEYLEEVCAQKYEAPGKLKGVYAPETLKNWLYRYRREGIDGLMPKGRKDKGTIRALSQAQRHQITAMKIENPVLSAKAIYSSLIASGSICYKDVSLCTIQRFISKNAELLRPSPSKDRKAFEFEFPNDCWQSDISVGPYITVEGKKKRTYIIAFLDDASRLILHCEAFYSDNFISLLSVFKKAVAKRGVPKKIFVDNGKVYKSEQMQFICAFLGTTLCFAEPYSPQSKGKIERWFKTMQQQWMSVLDWATFTSLEDLNASLSSYVERYNNQYHSSIKQKPLDRFLEHASKLKFISSQKELDFAFLYRVERSVKNDATISLNNELFQVPMQFIGQRIHVRYDPTHLSKAYIFSSDGKCLESIVPVKKIDNSKVRRAHNIKPFDFSSFSPDSGKGV